MDTLSKNEILRNYKLIRLLKGSKRIDFQYISCKFLIINKKIDSSSLKVLVTVSKKLFKRAIDRNLLKRRIKEIFRLNKKNIKIHEDALILINFIYKKNIITDYKKIENEVITFIDNCINTNCSSCCKFMALNILL